MTTTEDVIRLAKAAGFIDRAAFNHCEELSRLIALAKAEEREACQHIAFAEYDMRVDAYNESSQYLKAKRLAGVQAAASIHQSIRARNKEQT